MTCNLMRYLYSSRIEKPSISISYFHLSFEIYSKLTPHLYVNSSTSSLILNPESWESGYENGITNDTTEDML